MSRNNVKNWLRKVKQHMQDNHLYMNSKNKKNSKFQKLKGLLSNDFQFTNVDVHIWNIDCLNGFLNRNTNLTQAMNSSPKIFCNKTKIISTVFIIELIEPYLSNARSYVSQMV